MIRQLHNKVIDLKRIPSTKRGVGRQQRKRIYEHFQKRKYCILLLFVRDANNNQLVTKEEWVYNEVKLTYILFMKVEDEFERHLVTYLLNTAHRIRVYEL